MQAVIGALRANLGLDSAQFERGAKRAESSSQRLQKSLRKMATVATAAGAALGVATLAAGQTATEIRRLSQVANTAPDVLQRMAVGAKTVGIEQEKLSDILKDVNDRVGDFVTTGGGPMADFFEKIAPKVGITADAFRGLSGADALQLFVSSLEKANVSQAEMVFYMEAMASDSTLLLPLLRDNASEMNRLADSSASLGAIMSNETVASLDKMNMAVGEVSLAFQGMRNRIAGRLAPALEMLAVAFTTSMREGGLLRVLIDGFIQNIDVFAASFVAAAVAITVKYVAAIIRANIATLTFASVVKGARLAVASFLGPLGLVYIAIGAVAAAFIAQRDANNDASSAMNSAESAAKDLSIELDVLASNDLPEASAATVTLANDNLSLARSAFAAARAQVELAKATQQAAFNQAAMEDAFLPGVENPGTAALEAANAELSASIAHLTAAEAELNARVMEGNKIVSENVSLTKDLGTVLEDTSKKAKVTAKALTGAAAEAKERFSNLRASMESSMESGFMSIIDGTASAKDAFRSFAAEVIKELYRVLVVQQLVAGISNAVAPTNFFAGIPGKPLANGTSYAQGGMTLVGERGPELVNMPRGSQVIDARRTASRMGNGDIVQNFSFNLSANGDESVRRIVSQAAPQIVEAAKAGVADAVRRGGSYGRAFA